ncbi:hypothetical protein PV08_11268 [Exophiala spinifera]|uniref:Uncharacterized protein n=1 Tax=Exophiala spinifera TaxID=91928 RepID=A0A0D1Y5X3_9EURO|nr:uncharacterized protein PV08_11268 [Exophiala spinifera]KIW10306.1 hypothetical protein PV08_11268 [Exophiala spinifera]
MTFRFSIRRVLNLFGGSQQANWPDAAASTGEFLRRIDNVNYWSATGPAKRAFEVLSQDIEHELAPILDSLPTDTIFSFDVYMRGEDPTTTYPVVMVICDQYEPRKQAQKIIDDSKILDGFPGMKSDNAAVPPDFDGLALWADPTYQHTADAPSPSDSVSINISGNKVSVSSVVDAGHFVKSSTVGGLVQHGETIYAYTAGHVFDKRMVRPGSPKSATLQDHKSPSINTPKKVDLSVSSIDLDYALVRLPDTTSMLRPNETENPHAVQPAHVIRAPLNDVAVVAETASAGAVKGILSGTPAYTRLPHSKSFQKVFKARFSQPLTKGDSGSWVMDESSHGLYGHVVAGGGRSAYVMPAHSVFEDAKQKLGGQLSLPQTSRADESATEIGKAAAQVIATSETMHTSPHVAHDSEISSKGLQKGGSDGLSMIRAFMRDHETPDYLRPQMDIVEEFCHGAEFSVLQSEQEAVSFKRTAWLGEGGTGWYSSYSSLLTARELYKALKRPRFQTDGDAVETTLDKSAPNASSDVARRLIFISDLDSWNIYALAATASKRQISALRGAILRYLSFESGIEVTVPTVGWAEFHLSLHLPYYAWRTSPRPYRDTRRNSSGHTLRQFRDVTLLDGFDADKSYLYEAQISCVIAGIDDWRWVAYCFVDTYFEVEDGGNTKSYQETMKEDPSCNYFFTSGEPECASSYFLRVTAPRIEQVTKEFGLVMSKLDRSSRSWQYKDKSGKSIRGSLERLEVVSSVLVDVRKALGKSLRAFSTFLDRPMNGFVDTPESSPDATSQKNVIRIHFARLQCLEERFKSLEDRRNAWERQLQYELTLGDLAEKEVLQESARLAKTNKRISNTIVCRDCFAHMPGPD